MVVCVEAGLGLDQAMRKVAEEMKKSYRTSSPKNSASAICSCKWAGPKQQVLHDLGSRSGVDDLKVAGLDSDSGRQVRLQRSPRPCACKAIRCGPAAARSPRKKPPRPR